MESQPVTTNKSLPVVPLGKHRRTKTHKARYKPYLMTDVAENTLVKKFSSTGRTGRRNALPDVLDEKYSGTSTSGLPSELDQLRIQISGTETSEKSNEKKEGQSKPDTSKTAKDNKDSGSQQCLATHL